MTVDTKTQMALTAATPDAISGSAQGIFLYNNVSTSMPLCTKTLILYLRVHTVESSKCELESATKSGNSELTGQLRAKKGIHSHDIVLTSS